MDSALIAVGWSPSTKTRAWTELEASISQQWQSGHGAGTSTSRWSWRLLPWSGDLADRIQQLGHRSTTLTAVTALQIFKCARDRELGPIRGSALYPKLVAFQRWIYNVETAPRHRTRAVDTPLETGMDNDPAWDGPMSAIDITAVPSYVRKDITHHRQWERPPDLFYDRCYALLIDLKSTATTRVINGALSFSRCRRLLQQRRRTSERSLAGTWQRTGLRHRQKSPTCCNVARPVLRHSGVKTPARSWSHDMRANSPINVATCGGFVPLLTGVPTEHKLLDWPVYDLLG